MIAFNLAGLTALLTSAVTLIGTELYGALRSKATTLNPETAWSIADKWIAAHSKIGDIVFRVATVALLAYSVISVAIGVK